MSSKRKAAKESGPKVPAYIVTYSDMVTLLLTFFVMLLSLANRQDPELVNRGRDSFVQAIMGFGLGMLHGKEKRFDRGDIKTRHSVPELEEPSDVRIIDAEQEKLRRIFKELTRSMTTLPSQIVAERTDYSVTSIRFAQGEATLNDQAKKFLTGFCLDLQQNPDITSSTLCVLGFGKDEKTEHKQWILSAERAKAVADFLQRTLSVPVSVQIPMDTGAIQNPPRWRIHWWGAGARSNWAGQDSSAIKQPQILIAILRGRT